jgi:asparagine synthase (glutamine-hydrolysing)
MLVFHSSIVANVTDDSVRRTIEHRRNCSGCAEAVRDYVLPEIYDRQKHPFMSPPARTIDDPLAGFCQDVLHSSAIEAQPFFEPRRARSLMKHVAELPPQERPAFEGAVLMVVSTCVLQERFGMTAD